MVGGTEPGLGAWVLNPFDGGDDIPNPPVFADTEFPQPKSLVVADDTLGDLAEPGIGFLLDVTPPHPKSLWIVEGIEGDFADLICAEGSGVAQASFEPQASALEKLEKLLCVGGAED